MCLSPQGLRRQLIKREKIKKRKVWDETAIENLQTCFEISDWDAMTATATDLDEAVDSVNGYILFCQDLYIHEKSVKIYPNQKPWVRSHLKKLLDERKAAFLCKNENGMKETNRKIKKEIADAKSKYKDKLENKFRSGQTREAWQCMQMITGLK